MSDDVSLGQRPGNDRDATARALDHLFERYLTGTPPSERARRVQRWKCARCILRDLCTRRASCPFAE
jgi:CRISPR/Cas system-associated exonuclease Cas4 (RecB family)